MNGCSRIFLGSRRDRSYLTSRTQCSRGMRGAVSNSIAEVVLEGQDLCRFSRDLVEHFRNLLVIRLAEPKGKELAGFGKGQLLDLPDQEIEDLRTQVAELSIETLLDYFDFMAAGDEEVNRSANPRFALETILVRLATLPKTLPIGLVLERLEKLEKRLPGGGSAVSTPRPGGVVQTSQRPLQLRRPRSLRRAIKVPPGKASFLCRQGEKISRFAPGGGRRS